MRVAGIEIKPEILEAGIAEMNGRFRSEDVRGGMLRAGLEGTVGHRTSIEIWFAWEVSNRLLQRERKAGRIKHIGCGNWRRVHA